MAKNAELLIRAGFVNKEMAGVYSYLPLGLRVFKKIENIIRKEMNALGAEELFLSSFHPKENWVTTGRWEAMDDLYKVIDSSGREVALGPTHEEIITPIAKKFISSYRDLPKAAYQFQTKFRMELRSKSGVLRGREFVMKDLYSFHADEKDFETYYEAVKDAYKRIFEAVGLGSITYLTFASGGTFSKYSHEFQTITDAGEDTIFVDEKKRIAVNKEVNNEEVLKDLDLDKKDLVEKKAIEVGNIFPLKTKFSSAFDFNYTDESGGKKPVIMGCYGIGLGRLMGTIAEALSDDKGLVWPKSVAPFSVHLITLGEEGGQAAKKALELHDDLESRGVDVLLDDRSLRAGEKFADADLIGIPLRVVVSDKSLQSGGYEIKERTKSEAKIIKDIHSILSLL